MSRVSANHEFLADRISVSRGARPAVAGVVHAVRPFPKAADRARHRIYDSAMTDVVVLLAPSSESGPFGRRSVGRGVGAQTDGEPMNHAVSGRLEPSVSCRFLRHGDNGCN